MNTGKTDLFKRRALSFTCLRFPGLNRFELELLSMVRGFLEMTGKEIVSKQQLFARITGNTKSLKVIQGYYFGLLRKGFCGSYEYIAIPGSECLGISEKGWQALAIFDIELERLIKENEKKFKPSKVYGRHNYKLRVIPDAIAA